MQYFLPNLIASRGLPLEKLNALCRNYVLRRLGTSFKYASAQSYDARHAPRGVTLFFAKAGSSCSSGFSVVNHPANR
jgi:hypothetical protein